MDDTQQGALVIQRRGKEPRIYRVIKELGEYYSIMDMGRLDKRGEHVIDQLYGGRSAIRKVEVKPYNSTLEKP